VVLMVVDGGWPRRDRWHGRDFATLSSISVDGQTIVSWPSSAKPYADFIFRYLLKSLPSFPGASRAVSETEVPIEGDNWFWADDNAKVLELLGQPSIWIEQPDDVVDILTFIRAMCDGPFIFRRIASPRLEMTRNEDGKAEFLHGLMNISCDLPRGSVSLGMRFHDGRTARNVLITGNYIRFCHRGKVYTIDVEDNIKHHAIETTDSGVRLIWRAEIEFGGSWRRASGYRLGTLTYSCHIHASSMFVDVEATLDIADDIEVSDVFLTLGYDDLSQGDNNVRYENVRVAFPDAPALKFTADDRPRFDLPVQGASYWCVAQKSHISGFALAVHSLPRPGSPIHAVRGSCRNPGELHTVVSEYRFSGTHRGGRLVAAEQKIITAGGFYDEADAYATTLTRYADPAKRGVAAASS
jgi:hypothetical protein